MIVAFIDAMRDKGHAVESICRVLSEHGCQVAARTYQAWSQPRARTVLAVGNVGVGLLIHHAIAWAWRSVRTGTDYA